MRLGSLIFFVLISFCLKGQEISEELLDQIENFIEEQDENIDIINIFERLRILSENPIDLNRVDAEDLFELRLLTNVQINQLLDHRDQYGDLIMLEELQSIPSFQIEDINRLKPFVRVNSSDKFQMSIPEMIRNSKNVIFTKWSRILEDKKGFIKDDEGARKYVGDENRLLFRYRNNFENRFRMGVVLEKDAGESYYNPDYGVDYSTFHIYLKDYSKVLKDIAVGDYTVSFGQGLIAHNSFGSGKGALITRIINGGRVIRPYSSVFENGYMRGLASTIRVKENVELSLFYSRVNRDGNIDLDTIERPQDELMFTSLQLSGNHRTEAEIEDRHSIGIESYGGSLKVKDRKGHIAINAMNHNFDRDLIRSNELYNKYRFAGKSLTNFSLDYKYRYKNFNFFGESAMTLNQGTAHIFGSLITLHPKLSLALHYRNYAKDYNSLLPNALGESSSINNEKGFYMGFVWQMTNRWKLRSYADFWKHPWVKFNISRPSNGKEFLLRIDYYIKRKLLAYFQVIHEQKYDDYTLSGTATTQTGIQDRYRMRLHLNNNINPSIELRTRLEYSIFKNDISTSKGFLLYQDFIYKSISSPLSFTSRIAFFDTDDFDSRIFAFENSLLYEFGIPAYFEQGFRYYINLRYRGIRNLTLELRYAKTHLTNRDSFSSGNEFIDGDTRSEMKAQIRYAF